MNLAILIERVKLHVSFFRRAVTIYKVQSPFAYELISQVIQSKEVYYDFAAIEALRNLLRNDNSQINFKDFGAGKKSGKRLVSEIAKTSLAPAAQGQLLFKLVNKMKSGVIIELGTCLGITTSYLMAARKSATVYTLEGNEDLLSIAEGVFKQLQLKNYKTIAGNFDDTLPALLEEIKKVDLIYIDGNHAYDATLKYVEMVLPRMSEDGVIVLDDLLWSSGMQKAWKKIIQKNECIFSLEIRDLGIVFMKKTLQPTHLSFISYWWKPWQLGLFM